MTRPIKYHFKLKEVQKLKRQHPHWGQMRIAQALGGTRIAFSRWCKNNNIGVNYEKITGTD